MLCTCADRCKWRRALSAQLESTKSLFLQAGIFTEGCIQAHKSSWQPFACVADTSNLKKRAITFGHLAEGWPGLETEIRQDFDDVLVLLGRPDIFDIGFPAFSTTEPH